MTEQNTTTNQQDKIEKIIHENQYLREKERLMNLKETLKDKDQYLMYMIQMLENQYNMMTILNENLITLTDKVRTGLNSTNQQLYDLSRIIVDNPESLENKKDLSSNNFDDNDSGLDNKEPEPIQELELDNIDNEKDYLKKLEQERMNLKKKAYEDANKKRLEQEQIEKAIQNDKRIEARAKLKAEEILIKKEITENKGKIRDVPEEVIKEFQEKYGRF